MSTRQRQILGLVVIVIWVLMGLGLYYLTHKPITPPMAASLLLALGRLSGVTLLVAWLGGLGRRFFNPVEVSPLERLALQVAVGGGVLALATLAVGATLGLKGGFLVAVGLGLGLVLHREIIAWLRDWKALYGLWAQATRPGQALALASALLLILALFMALAPPLKWDALVYHLLLPRVYLAEGRIGDLAWLVRSGHPQNGEMLYIWAMAWGGAEAATTLGWALSLVAVVGLLGWLSRTLDARAAWIGVGALLVGQSVWEATAWGYVDWLTLFYGVAFLIALYTWQEENDPKWLGLAGLMVGLGFGVKYTAGILGISGGVLILVHARRRGNSPWPALGRFVGPAFLAGLPWLLKNYLLVGNPVYPLLFPSGAMTSFRLRLFQYGPIFGHPVLDTLFMPLRATYLGLEGAEGYGADIGPLLLLLSGLAGLAWRRGSPAIRRLITTLGLTFLSGWLVWAVGGRLSGLLQQTRLYFCLLPAWAGLAALGEWGSRSEVWLGVRLRRLVMAGLGVGMGLGLFQALSTALESRVMEALSGQIPEAAYLVHHLGGFGEAMQAVWALPEESRVLMIYEPRGLYCWPRCLPDEAIDRWPVDWQTYGSPEAVLRAWRAAGFTHVLVNQDGVAFLHQDGVRPYPLTVLEGLEQTLADLVLVQDFGTHALYYLPAQP